jgi:heat shock protein HtpX
MLKDLNNIYENHFLYVVCSLIYFLFSIILLGGSVYALIITFIIYVVSIKIALSPFAEKMFRFLYGIRSIETNEEREYLMPIFNEVMSVIPHGKSKAKIELCIIDKLDVNACAIGYRTVAITKGAMKAFDEEQLKGIIAHEIAHIKTGDTVASMFLFISSGYFYLIVFLFKLIILLMDKATNGIRNISKGKTFLNFLFGVIRGISRMFIFVFSFLVQITLAVESRKIEYRADRTAYQWGFGEHLTSSLYLLEKINLGDYRDIKQKLTASHPRTTTRIKQLESMDRNIDYDDDDWLDNFLSYIHKNNG